MLAAAAEVAILVAQPGQAALVVVVMVAIRQSVRGQTEQQILVAAVAAVVTPLQPQATAAMEVLELLF
jgi:hypothetical protein